MARGRFITLEGGDGAGKTVQTAKLCAALEAEGIDVLATREPGGSDGAEAIRALLVDGSTERWDPLTEAMLHSAARRDHTLRTIQPALASGRWAVSDRYVDSMNVYQGCGQGVSAAALEQLTALALESFAPDLTIVLDIPAEDGLRRAATRVRKSRYERMGRDVHARIREGFLAVARNEPKRCVVVDAAQDVEEVHRAIWRIVVERLPVTVDG